VQPLFDVRALNADDARSQSVDLTFGTVCHRLYFSLCFSPLA